MLYRRLIIFFWILIGTLGTASANQSPVCGVVLGDSSIQYTPKSTDSPEEDLRQITFADVEQTYLAPVASVNQSGMGDFFSGLWNVIKFILCALVILLIFAFWNELIELAVYAGFFRHNLYALFVITRDWGNYFMGQEFVCFLAHKAQKKQTENAVQSASALRDRENLKFDFKTFRK